MSVSSDPNIQLDQAANGSLHKNVLYPNGYPLSPESIPHDGTATGVSTSEYSGTSHCSVSTGSSTPSNLVSNTSNSGDLDPSTTLQTSLQSSYTTNGNLVNEIHTQDTESDFQGELNAGLSNNNGLDDNLQHPVICTSDTEDEFPRSSQPILAICGMSLRLPAGIKTPQQLWEFLIAKGDARGQVPSSRYNVDAFHDPTGKPGTVITEHGYFLEDDIGVLDTSFFSMPRMEVERTDPQQRLMLEVVRECFESAGEAMWRGKRIGCFMGSLGEDWCEMFARESQNWGMYRITGYGDFSLSNRVSYELDLQGPSLTTRTACSSSLVALHEACGAIIRGDCSSAVVGGVNLIMTPGCTTSMTEQHLLSKDGSCKTFSADANGYARGEAITAIYVKRLDDALREKNPIRAIIRGTAINHDGKTPGFSVPSVMAQESLMRRAYEVAGITDFSQTGFVECHGTGTAVGDPIETTAVARVFGASGVYIGSIKPNFGHTEGASGLLSVIKAVLSLENSTIPPNIKFSNPNPAIPFKSANLTVPISPVSWPDEKAKRVSVNSFGVGGSNAHVVIDSAPSNCNRHIPDHASKETPLLLFSANSRKALGCLVDNYRRHVELNPDCVNDLAYTLAHHREHLSHRTFAIVKHGSLGVVPPAMKSAKHSLIMVFTGQGAQWPQMGRALLDSNKVFLGSIRDLDTCLATDLAESGAFNIEAELRKSGKRSRVHAAEFAQPLCTAVQIALIDTLASMAIQPDGVVGHSSGEIAAAYAAGALTAREAILTAFYRGSTASLQSRAGSMAAVGLGQQEVESYLFGNVVVACDNSPHSVTISGDADDVEAVVAKIRSKRTDVVVRKLQVDKAYHCGHMVEIGDHYRSLLENKIEEREPIKPFFSSLTGALLHKGTLLGPRYWQQNIESPVLFRQAVFSIIEDPIGKLNPVFLEIGPHSALSGPIRQILNHKGTTAPYASVLARNQNCLESLLAFVGKLYSLAVPINLSAIISTDSRHCLSDLPIYPWDHEESYWYESRLSKDHRQRQFAHHDLLGVKVVESTEFEPSWRNLLHLDTVPWLRDHRVEDDIVFPFAGYIAMAGEAVRQVTGIEKTFRLRHMIVSTALVIPEGKPLELITTLRLQRLTDTLSGKWWEFTIASHNKHAWTKHCTGEVMAQSSDLGAAEVIEPFPRQIDERKWFDTLRRSGLNLGPEFHNLGDVSVHTTDQHAVGKLLNRGHNNPQHYHIPPPIIDSALQLMGVASTNGRSRKFINRLPTACDEISISRCCTNLTVKVCTESSAEFMVGKATGTISGAKVLEISGLSFSGIKRIESSDTTSIHAAARLEWGPDIDFIRLEDLVRPSIDYSLYAPYLKELCNLCIVSSQRSFANFRHLSNQSQFLRQWICDQADCDTLYDEQDTVISDRIRRSVHNLSQTPAFSAATALQKVCESIESVVSNRVQSWKETLADGTVMGLYDFINSSDISEFIRALSHCKPNLRVLEIGSWQNSPAKAILEALTLENGQVSCSKYVFTSKGFISGRGEKDNFSKIEYATLDISEDPLKQGFESDHFDLIIGMNALQNVHNIDMSLRNLGKILHPSGHLVLQTLRSPSTWIDYIFGTDPNWWEDVSDGVRSTCLRTEEWHTALAHAGYQVSNALVSNPTEAQLTSIMIARLPTEISAATHVTFLRQGTNMDVEPIKNELHARGYQIVGCTIEDIPPSNQDIIAVLDHDGPFLEDLDARGFEAFQRFLSNIQNSRIFWVTGLCQIHCKNPRFAQIIGAARTIRSELLIDFATCEVDSFASSASEIIDTFTKFRSQIWNDSLQPDFEYCIFEKEIKIGRFYPFTLSSELSVPESSDRAVLDISTPGLPSTLHWVQQPLPRPLELGEVEIEVYAVGLNFRDVLIAMNIVRLPQGRVFGAEGAGIVRKVGPQVNQLRIGDRVAVLGSNIFATTIQTSETFCVKIPDNMSFEAASTMFVPNVTALYSLIDVGRLEKGQSILIHSACGGVGIAAIQVALMIGAEIYATVGTEQKVEHLVREFNIPRSRIFNSRDESFFTGLMRETNNRGVDLVLNSLSGELLHVTWNCVAPFGKMIEIGKRDLIGYGKLDLNNFLANRTYCCVDAEAFRQKPDLMKRLLNLTLEYFQNGLISTIQPIRTFNGASPYNAFRYMQPGQHIGRICVTLRGHPDSTGFNTIASNRLRTPELSPSASYLLIGGLGGLGKAISIWMVEHGARNLIYLSRNAGSGTQDKSFVCELNSMGCQAQLIQGDVTKLEDVIRAVKEATFPVRGILQMSMVLRDENFAKMTYEQWNDATQPKVKGTWNLHNIALQVGLSLDFFVLFGSLSGIIGQPGQANYASANTFLDAFVQYRRSLGLPASAIDIGAIADIGYLSDNRKLMQEMIATGFKALSEQEVLDALTIAMTRQATICLEQQQQPSSSRFVDRDNFVLGLASNVPLTSPSNRAVWKNDRRMAMYHNNINAGGSNATSANSSSSSLKSYVASAKADSSLLKTDHAAKFLAEQIGKKLFALLLKPEEDLGTSLSLSDLGMDSLVAIELRTWWKQVFGFDISTLEMLGMGTLDALGQHAAEGLIQAAVSS